MYLIVSVVIMLVILKHNNTVCCIKQTCHSDTMLMFYFVTFAINDYNKDIVLFWHLVISWS